MALTSTEEHANHVLRTLNSYSNSVLILGRLVAELELLHGLLEYCSEDWKSSLYDQWTVLEDVYAVAVDQALVVLNEVDEKLVEEAISQLRATLDKVVCDLADAHHVRE